MQHSNTKYFNINIYISEINLKYGWRIESSLQGLLTVPDHGGPGRSVKRPQEGAVSAKWWGSSSSLFPYPFQRARWSLSFSKVGSFSGASISIGYLKSFYLFDIGVYCYKLLSYCSFYCIP